MAWQDKSRFHVVGEQVATWIGRGGAWLGVAWRGMSGHGKARQGYFLRANRSQEVLTRLVKSRLGRAGPGMAGLGEARQGKFFTLTKVG